MKFGGSLRLCLHLVVLCLAFLAKGVYCDCTQTGPCSCSDSSQGTIDLSPLDGGGSARFQDQTSSMDLFLYSWNPCSPFNELDSCTGVSGCQVSSDSTTSYPIGTQSSAIFSTDPSTNTLTIQYSAQDSTGGVRYLNVQLICDPTNDPGTLQVVGEVQQSTYEMALTSKYCCYSSGPGPNPTGGPTVTVEVSISTGTILVIVFVSIVVIYIAAGLAIQHFVRKASGREMIPNYSVWSAMPGLVKDGVLFTFRCGKRTNYDKI